MFQRNLYAVLFVAIGSACGGSNPPAADAPHAADAAHLDGTAAADAFLSECGQPGDLGNADGIGKFCMSLGDCSSTAAAPLCSNLGDPTTFFCTRICTATGSGSDCGSGASCTCNDSNQCGCTPDACLGSGSN